MRRLMLLILCVLWIFVLSGCTVGMYADFFDHHLEIPMRHSEHHHHALQSPTITPTTTATEQVTETATPTPSTGLSPLHTIRLHVDTSVVTDTLNLAQQVYVVRQVKDRTKSFESLGATVNNIQLALGRAVTDTNEPPSLTPSLTTDWIAFQTTQRVEEPVCVPVENMYWKEFRVLRPPGASADTPPAPMDWSWPVSTFCQLPPAMAITELDSELWCKDDDCTDQEIWVDLALLDTSTTGAPNWMLFQFTDAVAGGSGGDDEQHRAYCSSIGCNGGGSWCSYCWLRGCGC